MQTIALWREIATVMALFAGVLMGVVAVGSSAWVWIKSRAFGLGGSGLTVAGVLLIGLSVYKTLEFSVGTATLKAEMQGVVQRSEQIVPPPPEATLLTPLTQEEAKAILIEQKATSVGRLDPAFPTRNFVQLTFSVVISDPPTDSSADKILQRIDRVVYKLDERWFDPNEITTRDRENNFSYVITVWGSTNIEIEIYSVGKTEPVAVRKGRMNLSSTIRLAEAPAVPN